MARKSTARSKSEIVLPVEARIEQLLAAFTGWTNEDILDAMLKEPEFVECIQDDKQRMARAKDMGEDCPPFNKIRRQRLLEQIRSVRHKWDKRMDEIDDISETLGEGSAQTLDEIETEDILRIQIDNGPIDNIFGDGLTEGQFGPVLSKTYLLGGDEGVGKSRLCIAWLGQISDPDREDVADIMKDRNSKTAAVYFQNEVPAATFKQWSKDKVKPGSRVLVSDKARLQDQLALIQATKPLVVFVDSLHMIMECDNMKGVVRTLNTYRSHALEHGYALFLICHLNKTGDIAGSRKVPYLVDCVLKAQGGFVPGQFTLGCPRKNRYGRTGISVLCQHTPEGVMVINSEKGRSPEATFGGPKPLVVLQNQDAFKGLPKPKVDPEAINKKTPDDDPDNGKKGKKGKKKLAAVPADADAE
jgi:predicted ATP-dependent serine protease